MAISQIWKLHSIDINVTASPFLIGEFTAFSFPIQGTVVRNPSSGDIFARTGRLDFTSFDVNFTTVMAAAAFEKALGGEGLPELTRKNVVYNLAQLYVMLERYDDAIRLFTQWFAVMK